MARDIELLSYLPEILQEVKSFITISTAESPQLIDAYQDIDTLLDNQFVLTADEDGIARWEELLGIHPKATNTLKDRRFRILSRINSKLPYTHKRLDEQLTVLCGDDGYKLEIDSGAYAVTVRVALAEKEQFSEVKSLLQQQVPANMVIDTSLMYNAHETISAYTHADLAAYTHTQLREEVVN